MAVSIHNVIARSKLVGGKEDAWAALQIEPKSGSGFVVVAHFKAADHGGSAFRKAEKYCQKLAQELEVPMLRKRNPEAAQAAKLLTKGLPPRKHVPFASLPNAVEPTGRFRPSSAPRYELLEDDFL